MLITDCGEDKEGIPAWIFIVSILAGLILIAITVLVSIKIVIELLVSFSVIIRQHDHCLLHFILVLLGI